MLLTDIGCLAVVPAGPIPGMQMRQIQMVRDAALAIENGKIAWFGNRGDTPSRYSSQTISARNGTVVPGLIDCHTHIPFAGDRRGEFVRRIAGESYLSIMQSGGGIRVSTAAVRDASVGDLVEQNLPRLQR